MENPPPLHFGGLTMFEVLTDGPHTEHLGYDESDWVKNGELSAMRHFIKDSMIVYDVGANDGE
jgi:hypothetical protein